MALVALVAWWAFKGYWVLVLMVPLLALAAALMVQPRWSDEQRYVLFLVFTGFLILVGIEFFYLKDHLDGDQQGWWRMNTLFKFYLQVWVMLGLVVGVSLPGLWRALGQLGQRRPVGVWAWRVVLSLLSFRAAALSAAGHARARDGPLSRRAAADRHAGWHGFYDRGALHLAGREPPDRPVGRL